VAIITTAITTSKASVALIFIYTEQCVGSVVENRNLVSSGKFEKGGLQELRNNLTALRSIEKEPFLFERSPPTLWNRGIWSERKGGKR
jgi:hypothetical protein